MAFTVKDWRDDPDHTTPITAAALEDLEGRIAAYALGSTVENLTVIRGIINTAGSGSIVAGQGFTITRLGTGEVEVKYSTAFSAVPAIVSMVGETNALIMSKMKGASTPTKSACQLIIVTSNTSVLTDGILHFTATGPV